MSNSNKQTMKKKTRTKQVNKISLLSPLSLAFIAIIASVGVTLLLSSRAIVTNDSVKLKRVLRGVMDSNSAPVASMNPPVQNFVVNVYWDKVQPNNGSEFNTASIEEQLAKSHYPDSRVRMRVFAGRFAPDWVKREVGNIPWVEAEDTKVGSYQLPLFWTDAYSVRYNAFMNKLAARYDDDLRVAEVTLSKCMTTYAEPMIRQISNRTNVDNALRAGYTYQADVDCLRNNIDNVAAHWSKTRFDIALNPFQGFNRPAGQTPNTVTLEILSYCRQKLGIRCVLGNNSLRSTVALGENYDEIYAAMKAAGGPIYFQTATPQKIGDYKATLQKAVDLGAWSVELNASYSTYDKSYLTMIGNRLDANAR